MNKEAAEQAIDSQPKKIKTSRRPRKERKAKQGKKAKIATNINVIPKNIVIPLNFKLYYKPLDKYQKVCFAKENSAPQFSNIGEYNLSNAAGYRMARASHGANKGIWYYEIDIQPSGPNSHFRIGWSTEKGDAQAPVGFDRHSYSYRDIEGRKFHCARRRTYGQEYS
eukprot:TRINITY_DN856_c1_g1_i1.p1 TRINITY_DN856_c1_g1~~TRINITY_DN856_c1_g1_i1.p1  ORF type:complete len:167 (-),score=70.32 TRINITY_DN856_c1_g1_i1:28-528(-)